MLSNERRGPNATQKWLSVVGIGADGVASLSHSAQKAISEAEIVFGGKRHLDMARKLIKGECRPWPSPFDAGFNELLANAGLPVCVLASGDPFHFGVGATLARLVDPSEMTVIPHISAFSLAASRLGWPVQDVSTISLHGRRIENLRSLLNPGRRIIALTSDGTSPGQISELLCRHGFGDSRFILLEALGGPEERVISQTAAAFRPDQIHPLNVVAIEVAGGPSARILPRSAGLPDQMFDHDGQITKREIRALTISALSPAYGELLWDVGAGSGSVAIEWMLADPSLCAVAIEANPERSRRSEQNAAELGVPGLKNVCGKAPNAFAGLNTPDAIFIGGGCTETVLDAGAAALKSGGRMVVNAVTLETERLLLEQYVKLGGELRRISLSRAAPVGSKIAWRPAMPVTQWRWVKP